MYRVISRFRKKCKDLGKSRLGCMRYVASSSISQEQTSNLACCFQVLDALFPKRVPFSDSLER